MIELTIGQFMVAFFMSMGAVCFFIWAVLSGMFTGVEDVKYRAYYAEVPDDERREETNAVRA